MRFVYDTFRQVDSNAAVTVYKDNSSIDDTKAVLSYRVIMESCRITPVALLCTSMLCLLKIRVVVDLTATEANGLAVIFRWVR